jgi:hypothetical protein
MDADAEGGHYNAAEKSLVARVDALTEQGDDLDVVLARQLMVEGIRMLGADDAWQVVRDTRKRLKNDPGLLATLTEITADKGSPEAAFAMYEDARDLTLQLRWLVKADALGHAKARAIADDLRAEGLLMPRG